MTDQELSDLMTKRHEYCQSCGEDFTAETVADHPDTTDEAINDYCTKCAKRHRESR
jgi:CO dehydrogenase/acetyl-CoA synthase delta subunit